MSQPLCTIVTPTFNRPALFAECVQSVLAQTYQDWIWWVVFNCENWPKDYAPADCWKDPRIIPIWFPVTEAERKDRYIPACIVNWIYPKVQTPYIYFLADDDLIDSEGIRVLLDTLQNKIVRPFMRHAVYGRCEVQDE